MSKINLEKRIQSDGVLADIICLERFLDINLLDWISFCHPNSSDEELDEIEFSLFEFLYQDSPMSHRDNVKEFTHLTICDALCALSNFRCDSSIRIARKFALNILVNYFVPQIKDDNWIDNTIMLHLIHQNLYEDYIPFPD